MQSRIKLRRTQAAINQISEVLREGEPLYSFNDKTLVIGDGTTAANGVSNRFIAVEKQSKNKVWAGPSSGNSTAFPTFRALAVDDLPNNIPLSKIEGASGVWVTLSSVQNKGSATEPIYFDANGVAQKCTYKLQANVPADAIFKYTAGSGISISGSTISNSGVLAVANGTVNKTIRVQTSSGWSNVEVYGLDSLYAAKSHTHNYAGSNSAGGAANSAVKLQTARQLKVALNSTTNVTFDGSANVTNIPVSGILPIANGGTGASSFTNNGILYKSASSNSLVSVAPASGNQVFMVDANKVPQWSSPESLLNNIDWSNISSWKNTYVWDTLDLSTGIWTTTLGSASMFTHGRSGNQVNLCRGSLEDIILQKRIGTYQKTGNNNTIAFNNSWIPRRLAIHPHFSSTAESYSSALPNEIIIDTYSVIVNSGSPGGCRPTCHLPSFLPNVNASSSGLYHVDVTLFTSSIYIRWSDDTCKAIVLTESTPSGATHILNSYFLTGDTYQYYALA